MCYTGVNRKDRIYSNEIFIAGAGNASPLPKPITQAAKYEQPQKPATATQQTPQESADQNWLLALTEQFDLYPTLIDVAAAPKFGTQPVVQGQQAIHDWLSNVQSCSPEENNSVTSGAFLTDPEDFSSKSSSVSLGQSLPPAASTIVSPRDISPSVQVKGSGKRSSDDDISKEQIKRLKNTEAARQSRKRKVEHMKNLESQVGGLEVKNKELERENAVLKNENVNLHDRVSALARQVEELHNVLMVFGSSKAAAAGAL